MVHKAVLLAASSLWQQAALVSLLEQQEAAGRPDVQATLAEMRDNLSAVQEGMRDVVADATRVFARLLGELLACCKGCFPKALRSPC